MTAVKRKITLILRIYDSAKYSRERLPQIKLLYQPDGQPYNTSKKTACYVLRNLTRR